MLPNMTSLQFFTTRLLFDGPHSGPELRRRMNEAGAKITPASFSRLMCRMEEAGFLQVRMECETSGNAPPVRLLQYQVTDIGVADWRKTREFFAAGDGPPPELVPIATAAGQLGHLTPEERRGLIDQRERTRLKLLVRRILREES